MTCTAVGQACGDGTTCANVNGNLLCRNARCPARNDCRCGGGGSDNYCYDRNNDGTFDECSSLPSSGVSCSSLDDCLHGCNSDHACVRGGTGPSCRDDDDCRGGGGGSYVCGDGVIQRPNTAGVYEECDDGNTRDDGNGCSADCKLPPNYNVNGCYDCGCVEKTVDPPIAGDNQSVTYTVVVENKSQVRGVPYMPYEIVVHDIIFQKKRYTNNDPRQGVADFVSTEGYIDYPDSICIQSQTDSATRVRGTNGALADAQGCFYFHPGVNIGDPGGMVPGGSSPSFTIRNLTPGNRVTFQYAGTARTSFSGHELADTTQFIDVTNEVRTQTNNDYANVTVSKPYLMTRNSGNVLMDGDPNGVSEISNLVVAVNSYRPELALDPDLFRNIAGLILSPLTTVTRMTSYLETLLYTGFNTTTLSSQLDKNSQQIILNTSAASTSTIVSEEDFNRLGKRPDNAGIYTYSDPTSDGSRPLVVQLSDTISKRVTIVVENGDLKIDGNIQYRPVANALQDGPSIAFIVLNGDIIIGEDVTRLDGVYIVKNAGNVFTGPKSSEQLVVNGSLFGDVNTLMKQRTWVGLPEQDGGSVVVNYDARIVSNTPPGLKDILGGIIFEQIAQ